MNRNRPEPPRKLSEAAAAYFGWLTKRLDRSSAEQWLPVDGTTLATLAELLESQEQLLDALTAEPLNATYLRLRLQYAAAVATYSRMVGLCPAHRKHQNNAEYNRERLQRIADELGLDLVLSGNDQTNTFGEAVHAIVM